MDVLNGIKAGEIVAQHQKPIIISSEATVQQAAAILASNCIISAPVYNKADHSFEGFFDYSDLVALVLKVADKDAHGESLSVHTGLDAFLQGHTIADTTAGMVVADMARRNVFEPVSEMATLASILPRLKSGTHRVPVTNTRGDFLGVVSQSDIIKALYAKKASIPQFMHAKVATLNVSGREVISVDVEDSVLSALRKMHSCHITSVALVDEGSIAMVLSMTDFKYLFKNDVFSSLQKPTGEYKSELLRSRVNAKDSSPVFVIAPDATIEMAIGKMVATHAHRVYICDNHRPCGVVSMTDIINALMNSSP